jgi:hypothetical protein
MPWPQRSPDLTHLDFLMGLCKGYRVSPVPKSSEVLKTRVTHTIEQDFDRILLSFGHVRCYERSTHTSLLNSLKYYLFTFLFQ